MQDFHVIGALFGQWGFGEAAEQALPAGTEGGGRFLQHETYHPGIIELQRIGGPGGRAHQQAVVQHVVFQQHRGQGQVVVEMELSRQPAAIGIGRAHGAIAESAR